MGSQSQFVKEEGVLFYKSLKTVSEHACCQFY